MGLTDLNTKRKLKIIFLSGTSAGENLKYYDLNDDNFFVGSWAGLFARRLKKFKPELDISIWRVEPGITCPFEKKVFGLNGIIWPWKFVFIKNILSFFMYLNILKLSWKNNVILHHHSLFDRFILVRYLLPKNVKIILSHHGGNPPESGSIKDILLKNTYRYASGITYLSSKAREYLLSVKVPAKKLHFLPVGADFNLFKPSDKKVAREKLNLDPDTVYAIYVGSFYRLKSVDIILDIYKALKQKHKFSVIFVGGEHNESNDLYNEVINSGCPWYGRQEYKDMLDFFNAADFYIHPAFNPQFGGLDVTWLEALACNVPVLSPQLNYLDFDHSELGVIVNNKIEALEKTEYMIKNHMNFTKCREVAIEQLDANKAIMQKLLAVYNSINN